MSESYDESEDNEEVFKDINEYYKLKKNYDEFNNKAKREIMNNLSLSAREKKNKFKKLVPKCILCKQPGGTKFSCKYDEQLKARVLSARCGNVSTPCNLKIKINAGKFTSYPDHITKVERSMNRLKFAIINEKNKLLFGYKTTDDTLSEFESIKEFITTNTMELEIVIREYYNIIDNPETNERLTHLIEQSFDKINSIKTSIKSFNEDDNKQFMYDAVEIYVKELSPMLKDIMELKYKNNMVWFDQDDRVYHLMQEKVGIRDIEFDTIMPEVIDFNVNLVTTQQNAREEEDEEENYLE